MYRQKIKAERKIRVVEEILAGELTQGKAAEALGVTKSSIQGWIRLYETFGAVGLMGQNTPQVFTDAVKKAAIADYLQGKGSLADISKKHGIRSKSSLRKWVEEYNDPMKFPEGAAQGTHRREVYMQKGRATTQKERIELVSYCIEHNLDYALVVEKYGVSYSQIYSWVKKFQKDGVAGLEDRRGKKRRNPELSELEQLREENRLLQKEKKRVELENIVLKKRRELERG